MSADAWFDESAPFAAPLAELRRIVLGCGLTETQKWGQPCYTDNGKNVVILARLKPDCRLSFFKGALLDDPAGLLQSCGPNTRAAKIIRFTEAAQVLAIEPGIRALIARAVEVERAGQRVAPPAEAPAWIPEIHAALDGDPSFRAAFQGLTPGRQRAYNLVIGQAKRASTRAARVAKFTPRILAGKGPNDCVCGLSKRMPGCDGSHRALPGGRPPI